MEDKIKVVIYLDRDRVQDFYKAFENIKMLCPDMVVKSGDNISAASLMFGGMQRERVILSSNGLPNSGQIIPITEDDILKLKREFDRIDNESIFKITAIDRNHHEPMIFKPTHPDKYHFGTEQKKSQGSNNRKKTKYRRRK
jgi:hypothetical protein